MRSGWLREVISSSGFPDVGMAPAQFLLLPILWGMLYSISILATVSGKALWDERISGAARGMVREAKV